MAETTNPLTCKQCGYANEGERVYCHNCGTKLDRTLLPTETKPEESLKAKQKRIKKTVTPSRGFFAGAWKTLLITLALSLSTAMGILIWLPPDHIPPALSSDAVLDAPTITNTLEDNSLANAPVTSVYTQDQINAYLQYTLKTATTGFMGIDVKFVRVYATLEEGLIKISTEQQVFGHSFYNTVYYRLVLKDKKLDAIVKGGSLGRLQIHPNLMKNFGALFDKLWETAPMKRNKKLLDDAQSLEIHKDRVEIVSQPQAQ